ncbi:hypothetical protein Tco_1301620 [Tanacetum coccineum]
MKRVNTFVDFRTELVEGTEKEEGSKKAKAEVIEAAKMKELMKIVPGEEEVAIDAIPLATKPPSIMLNLTERFRKLMEIGKSKHGSTKAQKRAYRGVYGGRIVWIKRLLDDLRVTAAKVKMDDLNITIEEYIRLEEEKARRSGKVFNWETAKYGKIWYDEDVHDLRSVETEFPAIVFNDKLTSEATLSCEPMVSCLNDNEIDFRISFDESNDEYYTVIYDENSFSYKIIYVNDLKTDSENDNDKVNMPLFSTPEPEVSYSNDLDFFKDFENEFPAIVYNDALTSKSDFLTEPTESHQHIDEFNLKNETSLSECDEKEQNILYFNDLFPFNVIYLYDLKSDKDNDIDEIDIEQSSGDMSVVSLPNVINTDDGAYEQYDDLAETMIWYMLKKTCVELIRAF